MRAIILSNGTASRMGGGDKEIFRVIYKHEKMPLIQRTVEMFKARGVKEKDIHILSGKHLLKTMFILSDVRIVDPGPTDFMLVTFKKAMKYWGDECAITFGDVLWSEWGMDEMMRQNRYRRVGSPTKHGGEGFGWKAFGRERDMIAPHCDFAIDYIRKYGPRPGDGGWQMYRHLIGVDPEQHVIDRVIFLDIDRDGADYTMDFDYPSDYEHYREHVEPGLLAEGRIEVL